MIGFPNPGLKAGLWPGRRVEPVMGRRGMAASAHPLVTGAAVDVLRRGGNAVDAAVAAGLVAAVVLPDACGLGGDLFAIVQGPGAPPVAFLGSGIAPRGASLDQMRAAGTHTASGVKMPYQGPLSVGVPGMVDGYRALLARFGRWTLAAALEPAIGYAEDGFALTAVGARGIAWSADLLRRHADTAAVFLPGGGLPAAGSMLRQPDLARTLRRIGEAGAEDFYQGEIARRIGAAFEAAGGALRASDMADHATVVEAPIATTYRGLTVHQTGLPSQGMILLEALNIVENLDGKVLAAGDAAAQHAMVEAVKFAFADRLAHAQDPAFGTTPLDTLLSKDWAKTRFSQIDPGRAAQTVPTGPMADGDTTYLCVADGEGLMVSLIQSVSSAWGSGVVAGDTGVLMNNRAGRGFSLEEGHQNLFAPGKKTISTLNCYMIADADGRAVLAGGTPGGDGQPQWGLQTLVALIDGGMDVQAATEIPRWTLYPGTDPIGMPSPFRLTVESRMSEAVISGLETRRHRVQRIGPWGQPGAAQACQLIARDPATGVLAGGSDPRSEGLALGF